MAETSSAGMKVKDALEAISFREYRPTDLERCLRITASTWPEIMLGRLDLATLEWYGWPATWKEVACVSDSVVGLLWGKIFSDVGFLGGLRERLAHATAYLKLLLGFYGKIPHRLSLAKNGVIDGMSMARNYPEADAEVLYFVVDPAYRGKGIGKRLMDRFVEHAKSRGAKRISVYTVDPGSDLGFYERYGFKRYSSFRDRFMSAIGNREVKGIIYVLDL